MSTIKPCCQISEIKISCQMPEIYTFEKFDLLTNVKIKIFCQNVRNLELFSNFRS